MEQSPDSVGLSEKGSPTNVPNEELRHGTDLPSNDSRRLLPVEGHSSSTLHVPRSRQASVARSQASVAGSALQYTTGLGIEGSPDRRAVVWLDPEYANTNPWHGVKYKKPVFSLGRPFPRLVRGSKVYDARAPEILAEEGLNDPPQAQVAEEQPEAPEQPGHESEGRNSRATAAGAAHGQGRNLGGQPVFNNLPRAGEEGANDRGGANRTKRENVPEYRVDGEPIGQREADEVEENPENLDKYRNRWARFRAKHPEFGAEFLSTGVAVFLGLTGNLSVELSEEKYGTYETACWAWGFSWMFGIYLGGGVSGAHMNPAVSISLSMFRGFPWQSCLHYVVAQFLGGSAAGALAFFIYRDTIKKRDPDMKKTSATFFSSPQEWVSNGTAFFNQATGSAIMMMLVLALGDDQNNPPGAGMHAFVLGLLVTTLKFSLGYNIGSALNPGSDFGPRVVAYACGYRGEETFKSGWFAWGVWAGTLVGSILGCLIYDGLIFTGTESPINYRAPGQRIKDSAKRTGERLKAKGQEVRNLLRVAQGNGAH